MAILSINGLDNLNQVSDLFDGNTGTSDWRSTSGTVNLLTTGGRWGGGALDLTTESSRLISGGVNASRGLLMHVKLPTGFTDTNLAYKRDRSTSDGVSWRVLVRSDGSVAAYGGSFNYGNYRGELFPPGTIKEDTWFYFAAWAVHSNTSELKVRINGAVSSVEGDYMYTTDSAPLEIRGPCIVDDPCITTTDYTDHDPVMVYTLTPDADRSAQDFAFTGAASAHAAISELPPDGDTSYISAGVAGAVSEFSYADLPTHATTVLAVQTTQVASRDSVGGTANLKHEIKDAADNLIDTVQWFLADEVWVTYRGTLLETNPTTSSPFTLAEVNGLYSKHEVV